MARGESGAIPDGAHLIRADRSDPSVYERLSGDWDEVVELSYQPQFTRPALESLCERAAHWTLVSTVSVYADNDQPFADETARLVEPRDLSQYPDAKVTAEREAAARLKERLLIARPGLIVGSGDPTDRFGYWSARLAQGGRVLVPTMQDRFVQVISVSDLAQWIAGSAQAGRSGVINAVGPSYPMEDFFRQVALSTGFSGELIEVDDQTLHAQDVNYWAGPRSLPLWLPLEDRGFARRDGTAFCNSGGSSQPLLDTLDQVLADEQHRGVDRPRAAGITRTEEAEVLDALKE